MGRIASGFRILANSFKFKWMRLRGLDVACAGMCTSRLSVEFSFSSSGHVSIGRHFSALNNGRIAVRENASLKIGDEVGFNTNCIVVCHDEITIGNEVLFGPNVCVYDHDHDFRTNRQGTRWPRNLYKSDPIRIGNNVWIGANSIILKGSDIGDGSVIAAGCVVRGVVPPNSVVHQPKETIMRGVFE